MRTPSNLDPTSDLLLAPNPCGFRSGYELGPVSHRCRVCLRAGRPRPCDQGRVGHMDGAQKKPAGMGISGNIIMSQALDFEVPLLRFVFIPPIWEVLMLSFPDKSAEWPPCKTTILYKEVSVGFPFPRDALVRMG